MLENSLAIFAAMLGKCFVTAFAPGVEDKHCYSPVYDGAHVRDVHVVTSKGKTVYAGETIYSRTPDGIAFTYVNSEGGSGSGRGTVADGVMTFSMDMSANSTAEPKPYRGTWRAVPGGYEQHTEGEDARRFVEAR